MNNRPLGSERVDVSVIVPAHNEQDNVAPLMEQFGELARKARFSLEVVLVDDGSTDQTLPKAVEAQSRHRFLRLVALPHRRGLTEALRAGFSVARGEVLVFYPADRQFHPADIPRLVEKVRAGYDMVTGRKIGQYNKKFVSGFYNGLSRLLFPSIKVSDLNSVKAFKRELIDVLDYRHDWHRFWVAILSESGYRIGEVDVTLYPRGAGSSKYGFWRIPGAVLDLLAVKFQYHTMRRPLHYFGMSGMALLVIALIVSVVAIYERFVLGHGYRPLLYLVMTLSLSGIVLFAMGFLAEAVASVRQQIESIKSQPKYHIYRPPSAGQGTVRPPAGDLHDRRVSDRPERRREDRGRDRDRRRHPHPQAGERVRPTPPPDTSTEPAKPPEVASRPDRDKSAGGEDRTKGSMPEEKPGGAGGITGPETAELIETPLELPLVSRREPVLQPPSPAEEHEADLPAKPGVSEASGPVTESDTQPDVPANRRDQYGRRNRS